MADTDPFGRAKDEDPLAEMGWTSSSAVKPHEGPADVASPERADHAARRQAGGAAPARGSVRRRRGTSGCAGGIVLLSLAVGVFAVAGPALMDAVEDEVDRVVPSVPEEPSRSSEPSRPESPDRPPRGLERASLLRRGNLAASLRRLRRVTGSSRAHLVRIDAESVIATVPARGGGTRVARATWSGEGDVVSSPSGGGARSSFPWSEVDPSAPARIVRATTRGRGARAFDYLVLLDSGGLRWSAFLKGGGTFSAAPDGTAVDRVG